MSYDENLDSIFGGKGVEDSDGFFDDEIIIPEIKNLDLIIDFALKAYKQQMDNVLNLEPRFQPRVLEISEKFLGQAKDAMNKKEILELKRKQLANTGKGNKPTEEKTEGTDEGEVKRTFTRSELLAMNKKTV